MLAILSKAVLCRNLGPCAPSGPRLPNCRFRRPRLGNESGFFERKSAIIDFTSTIGPCRPSPITEFWSTSNELAAADCSMACVTGCPVCACSGTGCEAGCGCNDVVTAVTAADVAVIVDPAGGFGSIGR